jgi:uncharacterized phage infection (PIP) family protein YhgE
MVKELENLPLKEVSSKGAQSGTESTGSSGLKDVQNKINKYSSEIKEITQKFSRDMSDLTS